MKTVTSQCLYLQFLPGLVDDDKLVKLYRIGIVVGCRLPPSRLGIAKASFVSALGLALVGVAFFHDEHAEVIAALLYPITACIPLLAEIEFVAYGADALVGPYLPVAVGHEAFLVDVQDIDHIII